ncbi:hypothetical protein JKY79_03420 [Candidatus Babeliales bacterium]|nr:hypothetical protein [Candidatus Babeliales bacterium]
MNFCIFIALCMLSIPNMYSAAFNQQPERSEALQGAVDHLDLEDCLIKMTVLLKELEKYNLSMKIPESDSNDPYDSFLKGDFFQIRIFFINPQKHLNIDVSELLLSASKINSEKNIQKAQLKSLTIKVLLIYGADPNIQDQYGKTALHYVIEHATDLFDDLTIATLLKNGANPNILDRNNVHPFLLYMYKKYIFTPKGFEKLIELFKEKGLDNKILTHSNILTEKIDLKKLTTCINKIKEHSLIDYENIMLEQEDKSPHQILSQNNFFSIIELLTSLQLVPNEKDSNGATLLHYIARSDFKKLKTSPDIAIEALLNYGFNPNIRDNNDKTAIQYANETKDLVAVSALLKHGANIKDIYPINNNFLNQPNLQQGSLISLQNSCIFKDSSCIIS